MNFREISILKFQKPRYIRKVLKKIKVLSSDQTRGFTFLNAWKEFKIFWPASAGPYRDISILTLEAIRETIPLLSEFDTKKISSLSEFIGRENIETAEILGNCFSLYGSDKSTHHDYHRLYNYLLEEPEKILKVFEIGLGTYDTSVVSNMGKNGKPGASLRAFRDYLPNAEVIGADVDKNILFKEHRIMTHYIDQRRQETFDLLDSVIGRNFDLMIDDGLHAVNTNLRSLHFFLPHLAIGGYAVIEDINENSIDVWHVAGKMIGKRFKSNLVRSKNSYLFVVQRLN